ncbi:M24 family metallopeptidase [Helicobacter mustelae]|uniref:Putative metallopeptidase n=1 Tax=Helicobacter mustelae (strain ATCC 43772 / CCUG 25715 / CIP 103759 / LMG 18044 / NCTC 12198 / R85-136P) TaxID=679897 RepID=D3UJ62_HELM1|nr:M24 family metallopeptidase [Helicobacter mustelae]CBG40537.1 putative metallopeptidase [Helicobacter mustelae 12198]SQH72035.1 metallopeptidase [Helicobacter mustelae]
MRNFITSNENAQFYECGYNCDNAWFAKLEGNSFFITDGRYTTEAREFIRSGTEIIESHDITASLISLLNSQKIRELYFDPTQLSFSTYQELSAKTQVKLIGEKKFHQKIRICKTPQEIAKLERSQILNQQAYQKVARFLQERGEGGTEKSLHYQIEGFLRDEGNYELSFLPIFGINQNAAKPHALPSKTSLKQKDLILLDAGIKFERYCSDCTRSAQFDKEMHFGKDQHFADPFRQKIYDIVRRAQEKTIEQIREGMTGREIDKIGREIISQEGYGEYFTHGTGHGIGLDIHELPIISARSEEKVSEGMVFSIEPGIYLPGDFGVRIEDLVVIKNGRAEVLAQIL